MAHLFIIRFMPDQPPPEPISSIAPEAVEVCEDHLVFPGGILLPLSARGGGVPGMADRPWSHLAADLFFTNLPLFYSLTLRREAPDALRSSLRARRMLFEGVMLAMAEKTGRRPSQAERASDSAMDAAESVLTMGKPAFRTSLMAGLFVEKGGFARAEAARRVIESGMRARGLTAQCLFYIAERALAHFQPGGQLFPGLEEPLLFLEETLPLLPSPARQVLPADDSVWIGTHIRDGRDVNYSFSKGLDPAVPPPSHATTLILGEPGAGKTTLLRWIMLQRLLQGRTILSIDPEGENNKLCEAVGGQVLPAGIPEDPDTCLMHPLEAGDPAEMLLAVRFLVAALAGESVLSPGVQAALHEAVKRRWERRPGAMAIADLVETLATVNSPDAALPMALLRPYMRGGLWEGFFDRPRALLSPDFPSGAWWNFDLSSLREENRAIIHSVLAWFLYHAVTVGKHAPALSAAEEMDIFIDEGWRLLRSGPFADLLDELVRRARKRGVGVMLITHLPADLMKHPTSLSLASTAFIGRLGPEEAFAFFCSLGVPEAEAERNAGQVSRLPPRVFCRTLGRARGALPGAGHDPAGVAGVLEAAGRRGESAMNSTCPTCGIEIEAGTSCSLCSQAWNCWELRFAPVPIEDLRAQVAVWIAQLPHPVRIEIAVHTAGVRLRLHAPGTLSIQPALDSFAAMNQMQLSARGYHRMLKLARTIADLAGNENIQPPHLAKALQYRSKNLLV